MGYEEDIICDKCGSKYQLFKHKIPMRDKDSETCDVCGEVLISWNGGVMYSTKLVSKGSIKKKFKITYEYVSTRTMEVEAESMEQAKDNYIRGNNTGFIKDYEVEGDKTAIIDIEEIKE